MNWECYFINQNCYVLNNLNTCLNYHNACKIFLTLKGYFNGNAVFKFDLKMLIHGVLNTRQ